MSSTTSACFALTGVSIGIHQRRELLALLGARVVEEWKPGVTHLVADTFRRTTKLMCAICAGADIVSPSFVDACQRAACIVSPEPFLLKDEVCEAAFAKKHGLPTYSLTAAVRRARSQGPLLAGFVVYCDGGVAGRGELRTLVEAAGGNWVAKPPPRHAGITSKVLQLGIHYDAELLREAACTQILRFETYRL